MRFVHLFLFVFLLFVSISCKEEKAESQDQPLEAFRGEVAATPVRIAKAEKRTFDYLINASGKIEAAEQVKIIAERPGYLIELTVKEGDFVEKGKILTRLDQTESLLNLEKAKIELKNAEVNYKSEILSFESIMNSGDTDRITQVQEQLKAKSGLFSAEIAVKEAQMDLDKTVIKSPISGRVADLKTKRGSLVKSGDEMLEVINTAALELKVKVLESDINLISLGQKAEILPVGGGEGISGSVRSINPKVDENGLVQVNILINGGKGLLPGMNARAIIRAPQNNSIVVPKQALVYRSGRPVVFTIEKEESKWNYVEVGKDNGQEVEILSGIESGMTVITSNNLQLAHQAPVQILKD
ncbi:efflux RND transporter periplasmic adaptor subunit [Aquiflexum gelatinilyticum]|uniref:efflux RND transporter periplasmic adaptor subunit n=1 Tax=Aquiflexum gelatinilyticum TaxID=2961943 RepID=UPI002167FB1D|nr:efflux RND transporter periplasmic adaptor subunit [Aquiflexum gelatinilyticum]MCS4436581.1 efflux RND transporter periplasmic adaptor subunit [Aquiflexum gelatinilyticum]